MDDASKDTPDTPDTPDEAEVTEQLPGAEPEASSDAETVEQPVVDEPAAASTEPALHPSWWSRSTRIERARASLWVLGLVAFAIMFGAAMNGFVSLLALLVMFGVVALLAGSLRSERLREALVPFELGALVVACSLLAGFVYDAFSATADAWAFVNVGLVVGGIVVLAFAFARPLVRGRRGERLVLGGIVALAVAFVVFAIPVLDLVDGSDGLAYPYDAQTSAELAARYTDDGGVRLGAVYDSGSVRPLAAGYDIGCTDFSTCPGAVDPAIGATSVAAGAVGSGAPAAAVTSPDPAAAIAVPAPASPVAPSVAADPATASTQVPGVAATATDIDPAMAMTATPPPATLALEQAPSGDLRLRVAPSIYAGVRRDVRVQVRSGSCTQVAGSVLSSTRLTAKQKSSAEDLLLPVDIGEDSLAFDRPLVAIVGVDEPLGVTRCASLVTANGLALVRAGGAEFGKECIAPLHLRAADRANLAPASFQSRTCAGRFARLRTIAGASIVAGSVPVDQYRECMEGSGQVVVGDIDLGGDYHALPQPISDDPDLIAAHSGCVPFANAPVAAEATPVFDDATGAELVRIDGQGYPIPEALDRICGDDETCRADFDRDPDAFLAKIR